MIQSGLAEAESLFEREIGMKKIGIICEYNPFHSGHAYQIKQIRKRESNAAIVCLMSGHATQRGELAIADKYTRAAMAVSCGADVVLELPYPYCSASAAYFAGAGVAILDALGVDELSFGSECADLQLLTQTAAMMETTEFYERVRNRQKCGEGSAQAYFAELQACVSLSEYRFLANDILALSYVRAIRALESEMVPCPLKREGSAYHAKETEQGKHPSATALRTLLHQGYVNDSLHFIPKEAQKHLLNAKKGGLFPANMERLDRAVLAFFRLNQPQALDGIAEMQGGLANRLHTAALENHSLSAMLTAASSKSYPTARLRRAVLYAMTGVMTEDLQNPPGYLLLLSAGERGRLVLRDWKRNSPIPIVTKFADAACLSAAAARQSALSQALDALFTLALPTPYASNALVKQSPYML